MQIQFLALKHKHDEIIVEIEVGMYRYAHTHTYMQTSYLTCLLSWHNCLFDAFSSLYHSSPSPTLSLQHFHIAH